MNEHTKTVLLITVFLSTLTFAGYYYFEQTAQLYNYRQRVLGLTNDYQKLKMDYSSYQEKTKNLRQITILSNTTDSPNTKIGDIINEHAKTVTGDLSIYYKNLTTNESIVLDADKKYHMASLYKVIVTLYILDSIKAVKTSLDTPIGKPPITTQKALEKIITESNNEYAQALATTYGWDNIEKAMEKKLGISFSFKKDLQTTVVNIGTLFEEIALSLNISDSDSKYLLDLLKDQERISKLPKYLPKNIYSHNKTGEFESYSHDAGIFYTPKANYILIFMSKTKNPGTTNEQMAQMSKEIYHTLNNN